MVVKNMLGHTLDLLGEAIVSGHYPAGSAVPPETVLCSEYGVSRINFTCCESRDRTRVSGVKVIGFCHWATGGNNISIV